MDTRVALQQEWITLQNNFERYETGSLSIKLVAVALTYVGVAFGLEWWFVGLAVLVLWLQEGIFKTYQARLGMRLLELEDLVAREAPPAGSAFRLHGGWLAQRKGTAGLLQEYATSAVRPTVAFPYAVLLLALLLVVLTQD